MHPIDHAIRDIKKDLGKKFVSKWWQHSHPGGKFCNETIVIDGNWKINHPKCAFDNGSVETPEFGAIYIGCVRTPAIGSHFCKKHVDHQLTIKYKNKALKIKPQNIRPSGLGKENKYITNVYIFTKITDLCNIKSIMKKFLKYMIVFGQLSKLSYFFVVVVFMTSAGMNFAIYRSLYWPNLSNLSKKSSTSH